jgi:hypothetical protein
MLETRTAHAGPLSTMPLSGVILPQCWSCYGQKPWSTSWTRQDIRHTLSMQLGTRVTGCASESPRHGTLTLCRRGRGVPFPLTFPPPNQPCSSDKFCSVGRERKSPRLIPARQWDQTPLFVAATFGHVASVRALAEHGACVGVTAHVSLLRTSRPILRRVIIATAPGAAACCPRSRFGGTAPCCRTPVRADGARVGRGAGAPGARAPKTSAP